MVGSALIIMGSVPTRAADAYVSAITAGLESLQAARPERAASDFQAAMGHDANDPAIWLAWGALMLSARQITPARAAFHRAARLAPESYRTAMALALCDLADGDITGADALFAKAENRGAPRAAAHRAYLAAMRGDRSAASHLLDTAPESEANAPLNRAVRAWLDGKSPEAMAAWEGLLPDGNEDGHPPLLAAFTPWKPFNHGWQANERLPKPPAAPGGNAVSGLIPLTARAAPDTRYVVFSMDGKDAGITNVRPYTWNWDSSTVPNGIHVLRLTAVRADGSKESQEIRVETLNTNAPPARVHAGMQPVDALLDDALGLKPDLRYARYTLAQAALDANDSATARRRLQGVVSADPKYQDAAALLKSLPRDTNGVAVWKGPATHKWIALTFDDGPNPRRTPELLDLLRRLKVRGTFFFVGKQAIQYPDIVRRAAADGHEIGNHTWNHLNLDKLSEPAALRELASTNRLLGALAGRPPRFFRPPGGNINAAAREAGAALDLTPAMWTFLGGKTEGMAVEVMTPRFVQAAQPGAIFLIHDGTNKIGEMLPTVVETLRQEGYEFVTLSELFGDAPVPNANGQRLIRQYVPSFTPHDRNSGRAT